MPPVRNRGAGNRNRGGGGAAANIEVLDISSSTPPPHINSRNSRGSGVTARTSGSSAISGALAGFESNTSFEFDTTFPTEIKTITWRVKDFTTMMKLKGGDGKHQVKFNAGESIDMPSKWKFEIIGEAEEKLGLFLSMVHYGGTAPKVYAQFDSSIKYPCGTKDVVFRTLQPTDMKAVEDWGWNSFITVAQLKSAGLLNNDSVIIKLKFTLYGKNVVSTLAPVSTLALERASRDEVIENIYSLLERGTNADFVIKVPKSENSTEYASVKVHKAILAARSPVFEAMFESEMIESRTGEMKIEDLSVQSLNVLLKFIYTGLVDEEWKNIPEEVVHAADKYSLPTLKEYCDKKLHSVCTMDNALNLLKIAKMHQLSTATFSIGNYIKSNVDGVLEKV